MENRVDRAVWLENAVARYQESLLRMCFADLGDVALAEDAVQETFLKAYRSLSEFRGESSEKTWLLRIAVNTCRDMRRGAWFRHVNRGVALDELGEPSAPDAPFDDTLTRAVMALKPRYREAILLCYYQGLTGQQAADVLGITRAAVMHRLKKAKEVLKKQLEAWYEDR